MSRQVQCAYGKCLHESKALDIEDAVLDKKKYYHADCLKTKEEIKEIIDLFCKHINPHPIFSQLQSVITNIVFTREIGSEYLLFGLKYYIENKIPLNYPQGLYYVMQNKDVKKAYDSHIKKTVLKQNIEITESNDSSFGFKPTKAKGFDDILGK